MTYQALYRVWRPQNFKEVYGQEMITQTLKNAISQGTPSHAYLFTGPRGTGKTSVAKIFSKAINCPVSTDGEPCNNCSICEQITEGSLGDVMEIDAASNNGVEEIRDIREKANYAPTQAKFKVYIIDEVHMLSMGAFNALLKTLEEPPKNVVFILATTEPHKIPLTIISRTQRFDFRRVSEEDIIQRMEYILNEMNVNYEENALLLIAKAAEGGMRDALSILDQALSYQDQEILTEDIQLITGSVTQELLEEYFEALLSKDTKIALDLLQNLLSEGKDAGRFVEDVILFARDLLLFQNMEEKIRSLFKIAKFSESFEKLATSMPDEFLYSVINVFNETQRELRLSNHAEVYLEVATIKLAQYEPEELNIPAQTQTDQATSASATEMNQIQEELQTMRSLLAELQAGGSTAAPNAEVKKAVPKSPMGSYKADRTSVYKVLAEATHEDLNQISSLWKDILDVLEVGQKALLNNAKAVAASPDAVVIEFAYDILCERAQEDNLLQQTVNNYLEKVIHKRMELVYITSEEWPKVRKDYIAQMNKDKSKKSTSEEEKVEAEDEIVSKAVEFFGEELVEIIE